jgi:formylglycine-generating enzyme required for sulfatase activity
MLSTAIFVRKLLLASAVFCPLAIAAEPAPGGSLRDCEQCPELIVIRPASFVMGSPAEEKGRHPDEVQHQVKLSKPFAIGRFEVSFDEWGACVAAQACSMPADENWGRGKRPVINITWAEAIAYTTWLSGITAQRYRLPTEAEWEFAARAGTVKARFWGNVPDRACEFGNVADKSYLKKYVLGDIHDCDDGTATGTVAVGSFKPNPWGLHDVVGNVWEWLADCHGAYEDAPTDGTAAEHRNCSKRIVRGGSWYNGPLNSRLAKRFEIEPTVRNSGVGLRVLREL